MRRDTVKLFRVGGLCAGRSVKFCERRDVSKQGLQVRRLRGGQLHLRIQNIELSARARIQRCDADQRR